MLIEGGPPRLCCSHVAKCGSQAGESRGTPLTSVVWLRGYLKPRGSVSPQIVGSSYAEKMMILYLHKKFYDAFTAFFLLLLPYFFPQADRARK